VRGRIGFIPTIEPKSNRTNRTNEAHPKKIPLLQLADLSRKRLQISSAPVPASTPFTSPLMTPSRSLQAEGRFQRSLHQFGVFKKHAPRHTFLVCFQRGLAQL
jgi:hypothetical protein